MKRNKPKKSKKRFREYGFNPGFLPTGPKNALTDVKGVLVGHKTKIEKSNIRTGVTIIDPGVKNLFTQKLPAAIYTINGTGKVAGSTQVDELGTIEAPVALTNTLAVGPVMRGIVDIVLAENPNISPTETVNVIVGETNDGILNDIHKNLITKNDVLKAYKSCSDKPIVGNVGAGTGTRSFSWKSGIGTSSRVVKIRNKKYIVGALVQANYRGALTIMGVPIGKLLGKTNINSQVIKDKGSCMIIIATGAPLSSRQLKRIAKRAIVGIAKTGSIIFHGSGDYAIAFSTNRAGIEGINTKEKCLKDEDLDSFFLAAVETVEESVYDALFTAQTMEGRNGNKLEALPIKKVVGLIRKYTP